MACFSRKRKGKGKLSDLPEEPEEGELMAPIPFTSWPKQFGKKSGASALIGVRNERVVENAEMRHSWFAWFVCERDEDGCRRLYWTSGTEQGRARFRDKLLGLGMEAYRKLSIDPDQFGFDTPSVEVEECVRNVVCGVPGKFADNYDMWLKSPQFERWTKAKEAYPWSFEWGIRTKESVQQTFLDEDRPYHPMRPWCSGNCLIVGVRDPEHSKTLGAHDVVFYVAKRMLSVDRWGISGREEAVKEMLAFPISHPAVCAPVGGIIDEESPTLLFPWWNGGQISHWIERELELRWKRTANGLRREPVPDDVMAQYDADMHLSVEIFRKHRLHLAATLLQGLAFMHENKWSEYTTLVPILARSPPFNAK
ncbi:hypothetical protein R1sor_022081 [Riccia sorocarpa]|uniref:Uncharacterized protein n=1 Tax=Riccia sorocarpa TaxID=122646 RepID=A0ABD3GIU3_9MARC